MQTPKKRNRSNTQQAPKKVSLTKRVKIAENEAKSLLSELKQTEEIYNDELNDKDKQIMDLKNIIQDFYDIEKQKQYIKNLEQQLEEDIKKYINGLYNYIENLNIMEISKLDTLY